MAEWITFETQVTSVPVYWNEKQRKADKKGAGIMERVYCSNCGYRTNFIGYKKTGIEKRHNYCPNCGADMREREGE